MGNIAFARIYPSVLIAATTAGICALPGGAPCGDDCAPQPQKSIDQPNSEWDNGDVRMEIPDGTPDAIKMTMDPGGQNNPNSVSTTVTVNDDGNGQTGGVGKIERIDSGDTVNVNGNRPHNVDIKGSGGTINVHNPDAGGTIVNTGNIGPIQVNLYGRTPNSMTVPSGETGYY